MVHICVFRRPLKAFIGPFLHVVQYLHAARPWFSITINLVDHIQRSWLEIEHLLLIHFADSRCPCAECKRYGVLAEAVGQPSCFGKVGLLCTVTVVVDETEKCFSI